MKRTGLWLVVVLATVGIVFFAFNTAGIDADTDGDDDSDTLSIIGADADIDDEDEVTIDPDAPWIQTNLSSIGGVVTISYRPGEVRLDSAVANPGFGTEIKKQGPPEVRVEFEAGDFKVDIRAEWDGQLVTEIDED